jgi:hypothetical protein
MAQSELAEVIEEYHRTIDAIVTGDPEPQKSLWSRGDDGYTRQPPRSASAGLGQGQAAFGTGSVDGPRRRASAVRMHLRILNRGSWLQR